MKLRNQKLISALLIISVILPVFLFSSPRKANAQWYVIDGVTNFNTAATFYTTGQGTAIQWKNVLLELKRQVVMIVERKLLQEMTKGVVGWINSGFHGAPLFLQNPDSFFHDIAKTEIKTLVTEFGYDPTRFPFGESFALNTINAYKRAANADAAYSLSAALRDPILLKNYQNNFNTGGWNGFLINTQYPQNNYLGFQMLATEQLANKLQGTTQNAAQKVQTTLSQGMGFLSPQICQTNKSYNNMVNEFNPPAFNSTVSAPSQASIDNCMGGVGDKIAAGATQDCLNNLNKNYQTAVATEKAAWDQKNTCPKMPNGSSGLVATTPGSVVGNSIMTSLSSNYRQSELGAALGNSISAILDALMNHFLQSGLSAMGGAINGSPSVDNFTYQGQTLDNTPTTTPTAPGSLKASSQDVSVDVQSVLDPPVTISGGVEPYKMIATNTDNVAYITLAGTELDIMGIVPGSASVKITDSSTTPQTVTINITVGGTANPIVDTTTKLIASEASPISITVGVPHSVVISGGVSPYNVISPPESAIATMTTTDDAGFALGLYIKGVSPGSTSVTVQDSSGQTVTVYITVEAPPVTDPLGSCSVNGTPAPSLTYSQCLTIPGGSWK